jgi:hypothetical protein
MNIRTFQPGDESSQVAIYNEAAGALPRFKPATSPEVQRRCKARDFDPSMRFYAIEGGQPVGYVLFNANGRVSYPWCRKGHESLAGPLFQHLLEAMKQRGCRQAFAAYRADWTGINDFFRSHGFQQAREMVNFLLELTDMPTIPAVPAATVTPLRREDLPAILALAPEALRIRTAAELEEHLFRNPYFGPESVIVLRERGAAAPAAVGVLVAEPAYADPHVLDSNMPCFRLGAFGTETMQTKRIRGLFSFLARNDGNLHSLGLDLLSHASLQLHDDDGIEAFAAQVPSDVPHLLKFYQRIFRKQGSFPVFERHL